MQTTFSLKGTHALLVGLGLHGGGTSVLAYLLKNGAKVRVTDLKTRKQLSSSLKRFPRIPGTFGRSDLRDVSWADIIVKNPGVPKNNILIKQAHKKNKPIITDVTLFQIAHKRKFDCVVTGTRGKTTTTSLIGHICKGYFKNVFVGGNNRIPVLSSAGRVHTACVILELSSFQIEDSHPKSHVSVFTNFTPDHLNRYFSLASYFKAKANLFLKQGKNDIAVLNYDNPHIRKLSKQISSKVLFFSTNKLPLSINGAYAHKKSFYIQENKISKKVFGFSNLRIFGEHNHQNIAAAICASHAMGLPLQIIKKQLATFKGINYRLQCIRNFRQRLFFNDTTATSPEALFAAYKTLRERFPESTIHLIVGGADKKLDFSVLKRIPRDSKIRIYPLEGTATNQLLRSLGHAHEFLFKSLSDALACAWKKSIRGDLVVLSPGAASFGMFLHEFDRGDKFNSLVKRLK